LSDQKSQFRKVMTSGYRLNESEASALEQQIADGSATVETRLKLLGYYSCYSDFDKNLAQTYQACVHTGTADPKILTDLETLISSQERMAEAHATLTIWFIDNMPDLVNLQSFGYNRKSLDEKKYGEIRRCWLEKIQANSNSIAIMKAAAEFFTVDDKALAESLYRDLIKLEPSEPHWHHCLARLLGKMKPDRTEDALIAINRAVELEPEGARRLKYLETKANLAFNAGDLSLASEVATLSLSIAKTMKPQDCGDTIHDANSILGRVALENGDSVLAGKYLLKASKTKGSPVLGSFGPNMILAEQLYDAGQHKVVIDYLNNCKTFWFSRDKIDLLDRGIGQIKNGIRPCFFHKFATYGCKQACTCRTRAFL
jgi:tetratricopeptide (TPR) repeat protein